MLKYAIYVIRTVVLGLVGRKLIDPIEVFYLSEYKLVYPIVSKSGNSSVKLKIIQFFNPDFIAQFPEIHRIAPEEVTEGRVQRLFFYRKRQYHDFCTGKIVRLVIRNPFERYYSFYLGVTSGRNILYRFPADLHKVFRFSNNIGWAKLMSITCLIPDYLSDKHFRAQSYFLDPTIEKLALQVEVLELSAFIAKRTVPSGDENLVVQQTITPRLNNSKTELPEQKLSYMKKSALFKLKYGNDLAMFYATLNVK